ncbi:MAG: hypothetical protein KCHDKBKB_01476 [Elusimicrobia bacterium]|nr:hypothetical protein [Elusimicrobiota bacterium]
MNKDLISKSLHKIFNGGVFQPPLKILFVCKGNYFRSPTLEAVTRHEVEGRGWEAWFDIKSAGIWAPHSMGPNACPDLKTELKTQGIRVALQSPRALLKEELMSAHVVFMSDSTVGRFIKEMKGPLLPEESPFCWHFAALAPERYGSTLDMPDPYYGDCSIKEMVRDGHHVIRNVFLPLLERYLDPFFRRKNSCL